MNNRFSPASIVSITGAVLSVIGLISFFSDATNLSVPTFFYGVPILLIGLAMKNSELAPVKSLISKLELDELKGKGPEELSNLIGDVTRFRYGQRVHLETSLQALKLWDENKPPQLLQIELLKANEKFGIKMTFAYCGVPVEKWNDKKDRLGRFFATDLIANITSNTPGQLELELLPQYPNELQEKKDDI